MKSLLEIYSIDEDDSVDGFNKQLSRGYTSLKGSGGSSERPRVGSDGASQKAQLDLDQSRSVFDESKMKSKRSLIELFASLSEEDDKPKPKTAHDIDDIDFDFGDDEEEKKDVDDSSAGSWLDVDDDDLSGFGDISTKSQNDDSDSEDDSDDDEDDLGPDLDYEDPTPDDGDDGTEDSDEDDDEPEEKNTFASKSMPPSKALQGGKGGVSLKVDKATVQALSKVFSLVEVSDEDMNDWIEECSREISRHIRSGSDTLTLPKFEATPGLSDFDEYSGNSKDED